MSTPADYAGRTVDLLVLQGAMATGEVRLQQTLALPGSGGAVCAGIQKLAQRWTMEFLTPTGSMPYQSDRGCDFLTRVRQGSLRTEADVVLEFGLAQAQVTPNLVNEETTDMPADERFAGAALDSVTVGINSLSLQVTVSSLAGTSRPVLLPISVVPNPPNPITG